MLGTCLAACSCVVSLTVSGAEGGPHLATSQPTPPQPLSLNRNLPTQVCEIDPKWLVEMAPRFFKAADPHKLSRCVPACQRCCREVALLPRATLASAGRLWQAHCTCTVALMVCWCPFPTTSDHVGHTPSDAALSADDAALPSPDVPPVQAQAPRAHRAAVRPIQRPQRGACRRCQQNDVVKLCVWNDK